MTKPKVSDLVCSACGRTMGTKPGVQVIPGLICDSPICRYQGEAPMNAQRDAYVVGAVLAGLGVSKIAASNGISRQRVYQVVELWRKGV